MPVTVSKKIEVKPGVYRNVHITSTGKAVWVTQHNGKLVATRGLVVENKFVPAQKWKKIVDAYVPRRATYKGDTTVNVNWEASKLKAVEHKRKLKELDRNDPIYFSFNSETRKVTRTSTHRGNFLYKGKRIPGTIVGSSFIPKSFS